MTIEEITKLWGPIRQAFTQDYRFPIEVAIWTGSRWIPHLMDPQGSKTKRNLLHRFFTITLPDNGPIALLFWLGRIQDITVLCSPAGVGGLLGITCASAQMLEWARFVGAWVIDRFPWQNNNKQLLAWFIGPRDFYAQPSNV